MNLKFQRPINIPKKSKQPVTDLFVLRVWEEVVVSQKQGYLVRRHSSPCLPLTSILEPIEGLCRFRAGRGAVLLSADSLIRVPPLQTHHPCLVNDALFRSQVPSQLDAICPPGFFWSNLILHCSHCPAHNLSFLEVSSLTETVSPLPPSSLARLARLTVGTSLIFSSSEKSPHIPMYF